MTTREKLEMKYGVLGWDAITKAQRAERSRKRKAKEFLAAHRQFAMSKPRLVISMPAKGK